MAIKRIGVVGCGVMGAGIVQLGLQAGYEVVVREINDDFLKKGLDRVMVYKPHSSEGRAWANG